TLGARKSTTTSTALRAGQLLYVDDRWRSAHGNPVSGAGHGGADSAPPQQPPLNPHGGATVARPSPTIDGGENFPPPWPSQRSRKISGPVRAPVTVPATRRNRHLLLSAGLRWAGDGVGNLPAPCHQRFSPQRHSPATVPPRWQDREPERPGSRW